MVDIVEVTEGRPRPTLSEAIPPPFVGMDTSDIVAITERIRPVEQSVQKLGLTQGFVMPLVREMATGVDPLLEATNMGIMAVPETAYALLKGMSGFADKAFSQTIAMTYGLGEEALRRMFSDTKGIINWTQFFNKIHEIGSKREALYAYEPDDPGAKLALKVLSSVPFGVKTFFDVIADLDSKYGTKNAAVADGIRTAGNVGELIAFGAVLGPIGKSMRPSTRYGPTIPMRKLPPIAFETAAEGGKLPPKPGVMFKPPRAQLPTFTETGGERIGERVAESEKTGYVRPPEVLAGPERPLGKLALREQLLKKRNEFINEVGKDLTTAELSKIAEGTASAVDAVVDSLQTDFILEELGAPWYEGLNDKTTNKIRSIIKKDKELSNRFKSALGESVSKLSSSELGTGIRDVMTPREREDLRTRLGVPQRISTGKAQSLQAPDIGLAGREAESMLPDTADLFAGEGATPGVGPHVRTLVDAVRRLTEDGYESGLSVGDFLRGIYSVVRKGQSPGLDATIKYHVETLWGKEATEAELTRIEPATEISGPTAFQGLPPELVKKVRASLERDKVTEGIRDARELEMEEAGQERVVPDVISGEIDKGPSARVEEVPIKTELKKAAPVEKVLEPELEPETVSLDDLTALAERIGLKGEDFGIAPESAQAVSTTQVTIGSIIPEFGKIEKITTGKTGEMWVRFADGKLRKYESVVEQLKSTQAKEQPSVTLNMLGTQKLFELFAERLNKGRTKKENELRTLLSRPKVRLTGTIVKQRKRKTGLFAPAIRQIERDTMMEANELDAGLTRAMGLETGIWSFEAIGQPVKDLWYHAIKDTEYLTGVERKMTELWSKRLWSGVSRDSEVKIGTHGIAQQKNGIKILNQMGIKNVPGLTPAELTIYKTIRSKFEEFYVRLNAARLAVGELPFPKETNYFTFVHVLDRMHRLQIDPITAHPNVYAKMRVTIFRFEKPRMLKRLRPVELELNARKIFNAYASPAIKRIHTAPVTAKLRELLGPFHGKFYVATNKFTFKPVKAFVDMQKARQFVKSNKDLFVKEESEWALGDTQPRTHRTLERWLNHVVGQKHPFDDFNPTARKGLIWLNRGLTFSMLAYKLRSAMIQPTALAYAYTRLGEKYTTHAIGSIFNPHLRNFALQTSKHLIVRKYDVHATDLLDALTAGRVDATIKVVGRGGLSLLQFLDFETARAVFNGAYKQGREAFKMNHEEARVYADDFVVKTQISASASDIAPIQRSVLGRTLSLFQTFTIGEWNFFIRGILGIGDKNVSKAQAAMYFTRFLAASIMVNAFFEDVLDIRSPLPTPYRAAKKVIEGGGSKARAYLMALKEVTEITPLIGGSIRFGTTPLGAVAEKLGEAGKIATDYPIKPPWYEPVGTFAGVPGWGQAIQIQKILKRGGSTLDAFLGRYPERSRGKKSYVKGVHGVRRVRGVSE